MSYYLIYNPAIGNALVGLSEQAPENVPDGLVVKAKSGDMPDMSRQVYNPAILDFYDKPGIVLTKLEYLRKFTTEERVTIRTVAKSNPALEDYLALMEMAEEIRLDDPDIIGAVTMLEQAGLLAQGRAAEILG